MDDAPLWTPVYISQTTRSILGRLANDAEHLLFDAWVEGVVERPILSTCQSPLSLDGVSIMLSVPGLVYLVKVSRNKDADGVADGIIEYLTKIRTNGVLNRSQAVIDIDGAPAKRGKYIWMRRPNTAYRRNTALTKKSNFVELQKTWKE